MKETKETKEGNEKQTGTRKETREKEGRKTLKLINLPAFWSAECIA
jgi:hypothetical protein